MDNQEQIGLIAWGLKLGKQVFFHSNFINPEETAMVNALEDIRGVVNFTQPNLQFYSLEFTEKYRIYTAYRTIFDWVGREGYLALSVLVPHTLQLKEAHTFRLLKDLVSLYETEYIDERHRIKSQRENPDLFFKLINAERTQVMTHRETPSGNVSNRYAYQPFKFDADLADYFDSPYRREFTEFKEVFFLPQSEPRLRPSENATKLNLPPKVIIYTLDIQFQDEKGNTIQPDNWSAQVANTQYKTLTISDLNLNDQISISAEKAGYNTIYQTIPLNTQFFGQEIRKSKVITFSKKQVTVSAWFLNKENHPLKGVILSISINEKPPSNFQVNERYDFKAYIDDSITIIARKDNAFQDDKFKVESFLIKNDICERRLCLADPTSFSPSPIIKPDREQQDKIQYSNNSATISQANTKRGMEPWQKATLILAGMFVLALVGYLVYTHFTGTYQASNGDSQNELLKSRLLRDGNDIKSNHYDQDDLKKWQKEYEILLKSGRVESTDLVIDSTNLSIIKNNQETIDTLISCIEDAKRTFETAEDFILRESFGFGKLKQAEDLFSKVEGLSSLPCSHLFIEKQNQFKLALDKIKKIEKDIWTLSNGSVAGRARPDAQKRLKKSAQDTTFSDIRRQSLKKY